MYDIELDPESLFARAGKKWSTYPRDVLPAWIADMDFNPAPAVRETIESMAGSGQYGYNDNLSELPIEFSRRVEQQFDWLTDASDVRLVADVVQGAVCSILAFTNPGDGILINGPAYPPLVKAITDCGRKIVNVPFRIGSHGWVLDFNEVEDAVRQSSVSLMLLCNPHNPTGTVLGDAELLALADIACRNGVPIVSDEVHADIVYGDRVHKPIASLGSEVASLTATLYSATKTFNLGGLRCAFIHLGSALLPKFDQFFPPRSLGRVNALGAAATVSAWRNGEGWLDEVLRILSRNRAQLGTWVSENDNVEWVVPDATYFGWLRVNQSMGGDDPWGAFLFRSRVALSRGIDFGNAYGDWVRINFATSPAILNDILDRLDYSQRT